MARVMCNLFLRVLAVMLALALPMVSASASLAWPDELTPVQEQLRAYVQRVNDNLAACGQQQINSLFELYPTYAALGVTGQDGAMMSEGIELAFTFSASSLSVLTLSVSDMGRFAAIAASCMQAASADNLLLQDAVAAASTYAFLAQQEPNNSYEEPADLTPGAAPRTYFSYYPNQYYDGVNWLQMTLVFPLPGYSDSLAFTTPAPDTVTGETPYEGYLDDYIPRDDYVHFEVFVTATPEPNSPASER